MGDEWPSEYATEREFHEAELARFRAGGMRVPAAAELATRHDDYVHGWYDHVNYVIERLADVAEFLPCN